MALSRGMAHASVIIGIALLALAFGCIAGGGVAMSKLNAGVSTIGLWAIYYLIPGIILLVAGFGRYFTMFAVGIGANVFGTILAFGGLLYAAAVWAVLNEACFTVTIGSIIVTEDKCICLNDVYDNSESVTFDASCSDLETVRNASAAVTILYVLLLILSVVGSILGCAGACCGKRVHRQRRRMAPPAYVVPYGNPNTMMMTRVEERRNFDDDPYPKQARYVHEGPYNQEPSYYRREPYTEERPYFKREPYTEERPYVVEERHYNSDRGYLQEHPSYLPPRSLPAREGHHLSFVGHSNESFDVRGGQI